MAKIEIEKLAYENLSTETKEYIKMVAKTYTIISEKELTMTEKEYRETNIIPLSKLDKKIFSLLIAGVLANGELKYDFAEYDEFDKNKLLDYIDVSDSDFAFDITDEECKNIYDRYFKTEIYRIINSEAYMYIFNSVNPSLIVSGLEYDINTGSKVVENYLTEQGKTSITDKSYLFKNLRSKCDLDGTIEIDKEAEEERKDRRNSRWGDLFGAPITTKTTKEPTIEKKTKEQQDIKKELLNEKTRDMLHDLQKQFVGQERAAKQIFLSIINNQCQTRINDLTAKQRAKIFIDGPSGTGKTAIVKAVASKIGIPCVRRSITSFSKVGYHGASLTDMLVNLLEQASGDLYKAQHGIIILEEIDKLAGPEYETMRDAIQKELLDFIDGGKYDISYGRGYHSTEMEFDTSNLTIVGLGALTELRKKKIEEAKENYQFTEDDAKISLVYEGENEQTPLAYKIDLVIPSDDKIPYVITKEDLKSIGFPDELVNRFNTFIHTDNYSVEDLKNILVKSTDSPMVALKQWIEFFDKKLVLAKNIYDVIAEKAYSLNEGARGNETIINNIKNLIQEDVLLGKKKVIRITPELINLAENERVNRKGRG